MEGKSILSDQEIAFKKTYPCFILLVSYLFEFNTFKNKHPHLKIKHPDISNFEPLSALVPLLKCRIKCSKIPSMCEANSAILKGFKILPDTLKPCASASAVLSTNFCDQPCQTTK